MSTEQSKLQRAISKMNQCSKFRKSILDAMLTNKHLPGKELFEHIMFEGDTDERKQGWIFESLCQILIILKCVVSLNYTEIYDGTLQNLKKLKTVNNLLKMKIEGGGNNISDITIKQHDTVIPFSIKYKNKYSETDVSKIDNTIRSQSLFPDYKIGLIVKDKNLIKNHKYKNKLNVDKQIHDDIIKNGLLFDETDIINGLNVFCERFGNNELNVNDFIDLIDSEYLSCSREQLVKKLHQKMTELKFIKSLKQNNNMWCISHKPRSGKSITILSICKYLLEHGLNKILIMTSVPATINSFIADLDKYIDFKDINYYSQEQFHSIPDNFNGIVFCSTQYLKVNGTVKQEYLKKIGFEAIVVDESHQGSSTDLTKRDILDINGSGSIEDIRKTINLTIFASGTSNKTKKYYKIQESCVFEWEIEDESHMKQIQKGETINSVEFMTKRHGPIFPRCLENSKLNKDYSSSPTQVLMKHSIPEKLIDEIKAYNDEHGTNYGYSCSSLFALRPVVGEDGTPTYAEEFELCSSNDGIDILKSFFECIISKNRMRNDTIMRHLEKTQTHYGSRKSSVENPSLFIVYLPTHTRNNTILLFHDLWSDYNIEYSNSFEDTGYIKEEYNEYIVSCMNRTKQREKRGCILFLGNKGSVGITYHTCDVTISLDDGHNLDNQNQRNSRALTEAKGKTIGINVDMNIQRSYLCLLNVIQKHRKNTKTIKTNAEILYYLFENNIFLFDPHQINNGNLTTVEIMSYYEREGENLLREIDDTPFLENIVCDDDMRDFIKMDFQTSFLCEKQINGELEGEQQDCPKGDKTKTQIDAPIQSEGDGTDTTISKEEAEKIEILINQTLEMCKSFLFPLLALISRSYKIHDFKCIFTDEKTGRLIISLLKDKKIELNKDNYPMIVKIMNQIIENNEEIVNNIREIYSTAPAHKLRQLIEKHFIPTATEQKENAEVPTPVKLVDEMLDIIPLEFWNSPKKVFEPCCGKGNFVLGIFDRFYKGLSGVIPDEIDRCLVIARECMYFADLTALNVFITTEILKCHIQSYCGIEEFEFEFNSHIGDTLVLEQREKWSVDGFDAVIGNPPYSTDPSKPDSKSLFNKFIEKYIHEKMLLFVVPSRWFVGGKGLDKFRDFMLQRKDIVSIHHEEDSKKWFGNHINIEGGVNYFLKDCSYDGLCLFNGEPYDLSKYDCIIKPKYHAIIDNVIHNESESINKLYMGRCFGVETNDKRFKDNGKIKCYVSLQKSKDRCKYIDEYVFNDENTFWKVITARANGKSPKFGVKFIGNPNEVHTGSYISFRANNEEEAKSLLSYLDTNFANYMMSIRKISQDISENTCKWIPLVPFDRIWNDDKICEHFGIEKSLYM
jgi:site-specific DNA-methyltransferase (adenine-specific)